MRGGRSADGTMSTVGDVGYVDHGFLYLTDRATFMIISGGVDIYPQECENLLITRPKVADAAVFGVPNADLGEEVKAVVQAMPGVETGPDLERELITFCGQHLALQKCPRSRGITRKVPALPASSSRRSARRSRPSGAIRKLYQLVDPTMRRALLRRFPYGIFFEVGTTEIVVYAVFHGARDPRSWRRRRRDA